MWRHYLSDKSGTAIECNNDPGEDVGLVVATRDHKTYATKTVFFTNDTYGREMAQDGAYGVGAVLIHDGTDTGAWTFSEPVGIKWVADSTAQFYAGAKSMLSDNTNVNDIMQVINNVGPGDDIVLNGNYVAVTLWIYVGSSWITGDSFSLYAHLNGSPVGNKVLLEDYFNFDDYDIWQYVNIPLTDMGLSTATIDAFRIENESRAGAKSPTFYIDEWYLQASGGAIEYIVQPDLGTWFHVTSFRTLFVDAYSADNADSTVPNLSYEKILGMTPTAGYVYRRFKEGNSDPFFEARITNLMDLLSFPSQTITDVISDGTNTLLALTDEYTARVPFVIKADDVDYLSFTVEDNFSQLLFFRISVTGYVENREG
jgi:hypothetical protein